MLNVYLWLKTLHILAVIVWFSGMIWLPQLLIRQIESPSPETREAFARLSRWMMRGIITPAMILTLILGTSLVISSPGWLQNTWLHAKLLLVVALTGYHGYLAATRRRLSEGQGPEALQLRRVAWLPVLALALIVALVVMKP
jgi:putative membrane protein